MRRRTILPLLALLVSASTARAQLTVPVFGGTATFFNNEQAGDPTCCGTTLELMLTEFNHSAFGFNFLPRLTFDQTHFGDGFIGTATLHGGATAVGFGLGAGPSYFFGEFDVFGGAPGAGVVTPDSFNMGLVGCNLAPDFFLSGDPYWNHGDGNLEPYYINACGPDQYALVTVRIPHVVAVNGVPVTSTPEPASLLLVGTGLFGIAGVVVRRRNSAVA